MTEATATGHPRPRVTDRRTSQAEIDRLRVDEKAHTRAGDALAARRRRLPMVEVDPEAPLVGAGGPVTSLDVIDGRSQLIADFQWSRIAAGRDDGLGATSGQHPH